MPITAKKSLSGDVDLSHFDTPSLRRGILLQARVKRPGERKYTSESRTAREARELGLLICSNFSEYRAASVLAIGKACGRAGSKFDNFEMGESEFIRSKYAPGLILDFPRFSFTLDEYKILGRCCLTICFNDSASKIWSRLVLSRRGEDAPAMVPIREAIGYFRTGAAICDGLIAAIRRLYLRDFKTSLNCGSDVRAEFKKVGNLTFLGIDEPLEVIESAIAGIRTAAPSPAQSEAKQLSKKLASLVNFDAEEKHGKPPATVGGGDAMKVRIYQPIAGPTGMFLSKFGDTSATIAIASARPQLPPGLPRNELDLSRPSSSLAVSKDLASRAASRF